MGSEVTFGQFIRNARELESLDTIEASAKLGVNRSTLFQWETDKIKPHKKHVRAIAELYGLDVKTLVHLLNR